MKGTQLMTIRLFLLAMMSICMFGCNATQTQQSENELWINPKCKPLGLDKIGPFVMPDEKSILCIENNSAFISIDEGKSWQSHQIASEEKLKASNEQAIIKTSDGVIVAAFMNFADDKVWGWDKEKNQPIEGVRLTVWTVRSFDGGKTWVDFQRIQDGYCGAVRDMIETKDGRLVLVSQLMTYPQPYHTTLTYISDDKGKSWKASNIIDIGGRGHHDGIIEGTVVQLKDGRIWLVMRTNKDCFWQAFSKDGLNWTDIGAANISTSSSPAYIHRLESGRLIMAYNQLYPEGKNEYRRFSSVYSVDPGSWHREELSVALSDDDGKNWTKPVVIARQKDKRLSYPYILEREPGVVWITTMQGRLAISLNEKDFCKDKD